MDATGFKAKHAGLEEGFWGAESLVTDGDNLTVGKLVGFLQAGALGSSLDLLFEIKSDVAELLLDISDNFSFSGGGEGITALSQDLHQVVGQITTSHVDTRNGVRKRETFVDRNNVSDTVAGVKNDTSGTTRCIEREHGLDGDVECRCVEGLEDNLCHLLSV